MNIVFRFIGAITTIYIFVVLTSRKAFAQPTITDIVADAGLYKSMDNVVYSVMTIGGIWIVAMLVWGGMTLAGSGGNSQKRTEGIFKISLVVLGAYVIFKAHTIAGWATGIGSAYK